MRREGQERHAKGSGPVHWGTAPRERSCRPNDRCRSYETTGGPDVLIRSDVVSQRPRSCIQTTWRNTTAATGNVFVQRRRVQEKWTTSLFFTGEREADVTDVFTYIYIYTVYIYINIYIYIYVYIHTYIYIYVYIDTRAVKRWQILFRLITGFCGLIMINHILPIFSGGGASDFFSSRRIGALLKKKILINPVIFHSTNRYIYIYMYVYINI